jgi:hypothetical protein
MVNVYECDISGMCPYGEAVGMYFCRDHCGLGVDTNTPPEDEVEDSISDDEPEIDESMNPYDGTYEHDYPEDYFCE